MGSALGASSAYAQDRAPAATDDEITVTGTRIRRDDYTSTTATQNITAEDMARLGLTSAADMLAQLPSNVGTFAIDMSGEETSFFVGSTMANLRGMNTALGTRTLVLVDGRRQVATTNGGGVDLSFVPSILINRMEAVTGGASAVYGSDATAGVINVLLDRNVTGLRLDANFGQNKNGDLRTYGVSVASGINNLLDGNGSLTMSYEHAVTEPTASCGEIFEWCAKSATLISSATGSQLWRVNPTTGLDEQCGGPFPQPICSTGSVIAVRSRLFPNEDLPHNVFYEDMHLLHEATTFGSLHTSGPRRSNLAVAPTTAIPNPLQGHSEATAEQFLAFNQEGTALVPFQESLTPFWREYAYGGRTRRVQGGDGPLVTIGSPTRNGQTRDNIFASFQWRPNSDVRVNTTLRYGVTEGEQIRNAPRNLQGQSCIYLPIRAGAPGIVAVAGTGANTNIQGIPFNPSLLAVPGTATGQTTNATYNGDAAYAGDFFQILNPPAGASTGRFVRHMGPENGFLDPRAPNPIDPASLQILLDRSLAYGTIANPAVPVGGTAFTVTSAMLTDQTPTDSITPTSYSTCSINPPSLGGAISAVAPFQARQGINIDKNWGDWLDRRVLTDTDTASLGITGSGPLLGGDRWSWDASIQFGHTNRSQYRTDQQRGFRYTMAADAVYDPAQNAVVCRVNAIDPSTGGQNTREIYRNYILGLSSNDVFLSSVGGTVNGTPVTVSQDLLDQGMAQVDLLREGCQPINPFGQGYQTGNDADFARQQAAINFAFSDQIETSESDQLTASFSVSGDIWKGFGAGPLRMAGGFDYRDDSQLNRNESAGGGAPIVKTDFTTQYGDPWNGLTEAYELFSEFELPLVRDRIGARSLTVNFTGRRTLNKTARKTIAESTTFVERTSQDYDTQRYGSSWRASFNWSTTDWMRVRITKSADIRSPSSRELFASVTGVSGGFGFSGGGVDNPWRSDLGTNDTEDDYSSIRGSNENLENEENSTRTLGIVFSPRGVASGLQLSVDYSELTVSGGISYLNDGFGAGATDEEDRISSSDGSSLAGLPYPIYRCYADNSPFWCSKVIFNPEGSADEPNVNGIDPYGPECQAAADCAARTDIVAYMNVPFNAEPYWTRNVDYSANYSFQMDGGGSISVRLLATHALEQSRCLQVIRSADGMTAECAPGQRTNIIGVTGNGGGQQGFSNFSSQPSWSGNLYSTYQRGPFTITGQARYTGKGRQSLTSIGQGDPGFALNTYGTWYSMALPAWTTWNLTTGYNFARSRFAPERFENLQLTLTIDNLFDKQPDFYSCADCTGGVNTRFYNGNGRTFRLNFRSAF